MEQNSSGKIILNFIKSNKRYLVVLIVILGAFIFGKNMGVLTPVQQQMQDQSYTQQRTIFGIHDVRADQQEYELKNQFSIKKGQCGRLFFDLKSLPIKDSSGDYIYENVKVKVLLSNNFVEKQEIGSYELQNDRFVQKELVYLCANADYSDLLFQKDENSKESSFEISNISFYPLTIEKHDFNNLITPIVGNTDFSKIIYESGLEIKDASNATKFTRRNQMIGQTFVANTDMISGVDLKLEFTGVGGIGNYYLELRETEDLNRKVGLSPDRIAYFGFNKDSAERDLKIEEGIYHIPLASHLEKGKTYFIGINNTEVKFNILNTLKIYGSTAGNSQSRIMTSVKGKTDSKTGSLYMRAYGADYVKAGEEKVLTGAKILDNGDGTGQYIYEQKGKFSDFLDIDQIISKKNTSIFYDNIQGGISAKDEDDNTFFYKINTMYPFTKLKVEAMQPGGEFTNSLVYYSFDNVNWTEIKDDYDKDDSLPEANQNKFQELLQGDGKAKTVYIKVTYDKEDAKEKSTHLFGLRNLKVNAEVTVSK